jgi:hypothetical protein
MVEYGQISPALIPGDMGRADSFGSFFALTYLLHAHAICRAGSGQRGFWRFLFPKIVTLLPIGSGAFLSVLE